jgi:hypothetical protein
MTVNISTQARNDAGDAIVDLIDQGSTNPNGYMEIRTGTKPTTPQDGVGGSTLLATMNFSLPAFGNFSNGISLANAIADDTNVDETGVAAWFRIYDRDGTSIMDGDITETGGGGDIEFDNINFIKGGVVAITSLTATMPQ